VILLDLEEQITAAFRMETAGEELQKGILTPRRGLDLTPGPDLFHDGAGFE